MPHPEPDAPGDFALTTALDADYARGWPHLHRLTDEPLSGKKLAKRALEPLRAIDPVWDVDVPRAAAHGFLHALCVDKTGFWSGRGDRIRQEQEAAAVRTDPFPESAIEALLAQYGATLRDTYAFPFESAVFVLEALYGTERVASALVARLVTIATDRSHRRGPDVQYDNTSFGHFTMAAALAYLRPRAPGWSALVAPLAGVVGDAGFDHLLRAIGTGGPLLGLDHDVEVALGVGDLPPLRDRFERWPAFWDSPRFYWLLGLDAWDATDMTDLPKLAKWNQLRVVRWHGTIRHPATARAMLWLLRGRSASREALAWLVAHPDLAEPEARRWIGHAKLGEPAATALAALGGEPAPATTPPKKLTEKAAEREIRAMFAALGPRLAALSDDADAERALLAETFDRYCEIRAAADDPIPEAYFTHRFADVDWKVDDAAFHRWVDLAVEVAGG